MQDQFSWPHNGSADVQFFTVNSYQSSSSGAIDNTAIWRKNPNARMVAIFALGAGGCGGPGGVGASGTAGGGGGGAGAQAYIELPAFLVPEVLFVAVGLGHSSPNITSGGRSSVATAPGTYPSQNCVIIEARGGGDSNSASGAGGGGSNTIGNMPLASGSFTYYPGHGANSAPGAGSPANTSLPLTGVRAVAGCPGAGVNGVGVAGSTGGTYANPDSRVFPSVPGGTGGSSATTPGGNGCNGFDTFGGRGGYFYGGTGGGSSHGSATGAGLFGGNGGDAGLGGGGGGGGACLTGGTGGKGGRGGDGMVIIVQW